MYDLIVDIQGHGDRLEALLQRMDYRKGPPSRAQGHLPGRLGSLGDADPGDTVHTPQEFMTIFS